MKKTTFISVFLLCLAQLNAQCDFKVLAVQGICKVGTKQIADTTKLKVGQTAALQKDAYLALIPQYGQMIELKGPLSFVLKTVKQDENKDNFTPEFTLSKHETPWVISQFKDLEHKALLHALDESQGCNFNGDNVLIIPEFQIELSMETVKFFFYKKSNKELIKGGFK